MAKPQVDKAEKAVAVVDTTVDLMAFMSAEEQAEVYALTGQDASMQADRIPQLKVNYNTTEDESGRSIPKGNFVYNQSSKTVDVEVTDEDGDVSTEARAVDLGVDLGKSPKITVLMAKQQYSFFHTDAKLRCNSQVFGLGEAPVGSTLKHACRSGECPRRAAGIDRKEKCSCQYVVYCLVDVDGVAKPAIMYVKGKSFMPFSDYLKASTAATNGRPVALFVAPTKLKNTQEKEGSVTYYVTSFNWMLNEYFEPEVARENWEQAKLIEAHNKAYKAQIEQKNAAKQLVNRNEGRGAVDVGTLTHDDDNIVFD